MESNPPPSRQVVEAVARQEEVSPGELTPPLFDVLDAESLDDIFSRPTRDTSTIRIAFEFHGYEVRVAGSDETDVTVCVEPTGTAGSQGTPDRKVRSNE